MTELYFLSENGNIINTYSFYGVSSTNVYVHYLFNDDGSKELINSITVNRIDDWVIDEGLFDDKVEADLYYANDKGEPLDEQQFLETFKEMTGYYFYDDNPVKPDWVN